MTLACEDGNSKLVEVVNVTHVDDEKSAVFVREYTFLIFFYICLLWFFANLVGIKEAIVSEKCCFLNIVQKAFGPPPFYLNICPILQGVFFVEAGTSNVF